MKGAFGYEMHGVMSDGSEASAPAYSGVRTWLYSNIEAFT